MSEINDIQQQALEALAGIKDTVGTLLKQRDSYRAALEDANERLDGRYNTLLFWEGLPKVGSGGYVGGSVRLAAVDGGAS